MTVDNVISVLKYSPNSDPLRDFLFGFCVSEANYQQIIMSEAFEALPQPLIVQLMRRQQQHAAAGSRAATLSPGGDASLSRSFSPSRLAYGSPPSRGGETPVMEGGPLTPLGSPAALPPDGATTATRGCESHCLASDWLEFCTSETGLPFCDVQLQVGDDVIPAHRAVLAARSGYFRALFRSGMSEARTGRLRVSIGDLVPTKTAWMSLQRYIYAGDVVMPPRDALYLLPANRFYDLSSDRLQAVCRRNLKTNVSARNVFAILEAADAIGAHEMKRFALGIVVKNFPKASAGGMHPPLMPLLSRRRALGCSQRLSASADCSTSRASRCAAAPSAGHNSGHGRRDVRRPFHRSVCPAFAVDAGSRIIVHLMGARSRYTPESSGSR